MQNSLDLIKINSKIALKAVAAVLRKPTYLGIFFLSGFIVLSALVWISNYGLLFSILSSDIALADKLSFFFAGFESLGTNFTLFTATTVVSIAVLSGVNIALLIYVLRLSKKAAIAGGGKNAAAIGAGILGVGCAACGTSILAPLVAGLGATASITFVEVVGVTANIASVLLLLYSIYKLGGVTSTLRARQGGQ